MKSILKIMFLLFTTISLKAQVPESLNYQAVARNNAGVALVNQTIKVRMTLLRSNISLYSETRQVTTNLLGLFNIQIGSAGALSTTGDITAISWLPNTPNAIMLKVEIDLNNTNVFTDMGTQPFNTVPFAFGAKTAIEVINLAGRYIDPVTVPISNSRLMWNGSSWTPVKKDSVINIHSTLPSYPAGGPNADWLWVSNNAATPTISVNGTERITAHLVGGFGHAYSGYIVVSTAVCYQNTAGGNITSFNSPASDEGVETAIPINSTAPRIQLSASGSIKLPAGSYKIGMCIKNKSGTGAALNNSNYVNGFIEIKY